MKNNQIMDKSSYQVQSSDKEAKYSVFVLAYEYSERPECVPQ